MVGRISPNKDTDNTKFFEQNFNSDPDLNNL